MSEALLNAGGIVGVLMVLAAYIGIHIDRMDPKGVTALVLNLAGSVLILLSMIKAFNLPAFFMEAAWAATAIYGLFRLMRKR